MQGVEVASYFSYLRIGRSMDPKILRIKILVHLYESLLLSLILLLKDIED